MADGRETPRFEDLVFVDSKGTPLPRVRPAPVHGLMEGGIFTAARDNLELAAQGNIHDLLVSMTLPPVNIGPGLDKHWAVLHPLLNRKERT